MSSELGKNIKISVFGQSHSEAIGVVIDGIPAGIRFDRESIIQFMKRRAPGRNEFSTKRKEADLPEIVSGVLEAEDGALVSCGAPICALIHNTNQRSSDYEALRFVPRPGHADYTAAVKCEGFNDIRGGGHFSGRLTAPLCFAGALAVQILEQEGIAVGAHIKSIAKVEDESFDPMGTDRESLKAPGAKDFPVINDGQGEKMKAAIALAKEEQDSVGGIVECMLTGLPVGLGAPMFDGIENLLARAIFGIPAVKGIEFGEGFNASRLRGSENNDSFCVDDEGNIRQSSNRAGGILGGITNGMPIVFRAAFKPTPSIGRAQSSVNLMTREPEELVIHGRHDPCIVPRAVPVVEAVAALVMLDILMDK